MLADLLAQDVTITHATRSTAGAYGNPALTLTPTVTRGRLDQRSTVELVAGRETAVSQTVLFLAADETVGPLDTVTVNGATYTVDGEPWQVQGRTGTHHLEVPLRRVDEP